MDTALATGITAGIAQGIVALINLYAARTNKPAGWRPTDSDWLVIEEWANKTPEDIKREAAERLGVDWKPQ